MSRHRTGAVAAGARPGRAAGSGRAPDGLAQAAEIADRLPGGAAPEFLARGDCLLVTRASARLLDAALVAEPPSGAGWRLHRGGHDADLDAARTLRDEGRGVIAKLQADYVADTGVQSLKIKHNNVLGYFIETTATHARKMLSPPLSERFIHRQTTANAVRFTTLDLSELETRILNAGSRALEIEMALFRSLARAVLAESMTASGRPRGRSPRLDVQSALARARDRRRLVPPRDP
jgi:DNA mismatch repair protein MutS